MTLFTIPIISQLETVMQHVLNFFHTNLNLPWAWAIVGTTVIVRMLLVPLTIKQIHSMQNLQRYAPQMKEIQKKYKHDKQKQNEELMKFYRENSINPAASCLPMLLQLPVFISLYYTLKNFDSNFPEAAHQNLSWLHFVPNITAHTTSFWGGYVLLVVYVASQMASTLFMAPTADKTQRTLFMIMPLVFVFVIARFPAGLVLYWVTTNLWTVGTGADHTATGRPDAGTVARAAQLADPAEGRRLERQRREPRGAGPEAGPDGLAAAAPGATQEEEAHEPEMNEMAGLTAEATGETVGEAKWAALRELERRHPGLDKAAVQFEVIAEGERGILGVGYEPARVVAHLPSDAAEAAATAAPATDEGDQAAEARALVAQIVGTLGVDADVVARDEPEAIVITCSGPDVGLLIGRHGQTIDAVQYLLNVIAYRAYGDEKRDVVVDAAGYRARRQATLESLADRVADRVLESGEPEELEPMTAVERKVVHLRLKDVAGVGTTSEGTEPNRYVVVVPDSEL